MKVHLNSKGANNASKALLEDQRLMGVLYDLEQQRIDLDTRLRNVAVQRSVVIIRPLAKVMNAYWEFFKQGMKLIEPYKQLISEMQQEAKKQKAEAGQNLGKIRKMSQLKLKAIREKKELNFQKVKNAVSTGLGIRDLRADGQSSMDKKITVKEGYLFTPSPNFARVWVAVKNGAIRVDPQEMQNASFNRSLTLDMMLCTVKEKREAKVRLLFEVVSPYGNIELQATSLSEMHDWMNVIQNAISDSLMNRKSESSSPNKNMIMSGNGQMIDEKKKKEY